MVEYIEEFSAILQFEALADFHVFEQREIDLFETRPEYSIASEVSERAGRRHAESRRIQPVIGTAVFRIWINAGDGVGPLIGEVAVAECVRADENRIGDAGPQNAQRRQFPAAGQKSADAFSGAEEPVSGSDRQFIKSVEVDSVPNIAARIAAFGLQVVVVLRLRREKPLILDIVNRVSPGVIDVILQSGADPPLKRDLQRMVDVLPRRGLDVYGAELRIRAQSGYPINEVDVQVAPQVEAMIAQVRDLNRVVSCQFARNGQVPMLNVNVALDPIETGDGRGRAD